MINNPVYRICFKYFTSILLFFFTANPLIAQVPKVACGTIKYLENLPSKFVDARNVDVWLPNGSSR
jgi:hypothetical protein